VPPEDEVLARALEGAGLTVGHPVWDDPSVDWGAFAITVVRSTWDYHHRRLAFLRWIRKAARDGDLWNRPEVLRWNTHKQYLRTLERAGVPIVPTLWTRGPRPVDLADAMDRRGWPTTVVKPAVSVGGDRTYRIDRRNAREGQRRLEEIGRTGTAMVQPYLTSGAKGGERSLIYLDGRYSHAVCRVPLFDRPEDPPKETLTSPSPEMRRIAQSALAASPGPLLYARVDLIEDAAGGWRVIEVELTEPSLFFVPYPAGARTLAHAIGRILRR